MKLLAQGQAHLFVEIKTEHDINFNNLYLSLIRIYFW